MYGIVRAVEYNPQINQSRLHFESIHIEEDMKNAILSFVYNVLPQDKKDVFDALSATEQDMAEDETAPKEEEPVELQPLDGVPPEAPIKTEELFSKPKALQKEDLDDLAAIDVSDEI